MKKYLLAILLLALIQMAFGQDQGNQTKQDSVIVDFGRSGKIVILVDNQADFERLKTLDVNQIIRELNLEMDEKTGKLHVVELKGKEIVTVREDAQETEVSVGRFRVIVDEGGDKTHVRVESKDRKPKKVDPGFRTYFNFDLGINNYLEDGNFPSGASPYSVKGWGSWNVGLNWMASQRVAKGAYWDFGLGVQWYNFKFEDTRFQALNQDGNVAWVLRDDVAGFKSKVSASYLTAQTLFRLDFGKMNDAGRNGLRVAAGPYAGYRLGGRSKYVYRDLPTSGRRREKESAGSYLNNLRYGVRGEVGFRSVTFFTTYDLNELFLPGQGPSLNPISFGLVF
ncbi:hypothetical protein KIH41_09485 [Litoribacter ruber]|uniref:hypothetical protein n=1 Tax=Litoribacter ruber TaxID=702568 RepID=UPI001BDAE714|nr:hypothetical protein [Litoribacter ruber]MBT0811509.1 hypothetical protein [Litoribacter ruber]